MKTRSNMPLFVVECSDVKALSNSQIDLLRCGDYLVKKDGSGEHAYKVTFKSDTGMCITYHDASVIETQSYDKIDGVWTYNSEDKTPNLLDTQTEDDVIALLGSGDVPSIKGDEIVENMSGYSMSASTIENITKNDVYGGVVKNGNKLTIAYACELTRTDNVASGTKTLVSLSIPSSIGEKLFVAIGSYTLTRAKYLASNQVSSARDVDLVAQCMKDSNTSIKIAMVQAELQKLTLNEKYYIRIEITFLLSENLVGE